MPLPPGSFIASGPVFVEEGKVLLCRHGRDGMWKFPGGQVEPDDASLEAAAVREAAEELGIVAILGAPVKPMAITLPDGRVAVLIHYAARRKGEIAVGDDIDEARWFAVDALPPSCAPNVRPVLDAMANMDT